MAGFEYNREQVEDTYISDTNGVPFVLPRTSLAFFAENRWSPTHRLYLTTGFRVDDLRTQSLPADDYADRPLLPASTVVKVNPRVAAAYMLRESHGGAWMVPACTPASARASVRRTASTWPSPTTLT